MLAEEYDFMAVDIVTRLIKEWPGEQARANATICMIRVKDLLNDKDIFWKIAERLK